MYSPSFSLVSTIKAHWFSLGGTATAWLGVITANQTQTEYWLRQGATVGAIIASAVTIWGVLRRDRREAGK